MGKASRQRRPRPPIALTPPNPSADDHDRIDRLVSRITTGDLDADLDELIAAINDRVRALDTLRTTRARQRLHQGDRVRLTDNVKPRYLIGRTGEIHEINDDYIVVCLDHPVGRFTSGHIRCAPTSLEPLPQAEKES